MNLHQMGNRRHVNDGKKFPERGDCVFEIVKHESREVRRTTKGAGKRVKTRQNSNKTSSSSSLLLLLLPPTSTCHHSHSSRGNDIHPDPGDIHPQRSKSTSREQKVWLRQ